jgi:hypothetical protein
VQNPLAAAHPQRLNILLLLAVVAAVVEAGLLLAAVGVVRVDF